MPPVPSWFEYTSPAYVPRCSQAHVIHCQLSPTELTPLVVFIVAIVPVVSPTIPSSTRAVMTSTHPPPPPPPPPPASVACTMMSGRTVVGIMSVGTVWRLHDLKLRCSAGQDNLERYEYACVVPHKLFNNRILPKSQILVSCSHMTC